MSAPAKGAPGKNVIQKFSRKNNGTTPAAFVQEIARYQRLLPTHDPEALFISLTAICHGRRPAERRAIFRAFNMSPDGR